MRLKSVHIRRMPGFEDKGFLLESLDPGLNIIMGPNASGKTTTSRAIQGLLWEETIADVAYPRLWADFEYKNRSLVIEVDGAERSYQLDGSKADPPKLPSHYLADCYVVTVDDLFEGKSRTDKELARRVLTHMSGGFDLRSIRDNGVLKFSERKIPRESSLFQEARRRVKSIQEEQRYLRAEEEELPRLRHRLEQIKQAQKELAQVEKAEALLGIQKRISLLKEELNNSPKTLAALKGNEAEILYDREDALEKKKKEFVDTELRIAQAIERLEKTCLGNQGVSEFDRDKLQSLMEDLQSASERIQNSRKKVAELNAELEIAARRLAPSGNLEKLEELDSQGLSEIETFQRGFEQHKAKKNLLEERLRFLSEDKPEAEEDDIRLSLALLSQWLQTPPSAVGSKMRFVSFFLFFLSALLILGLGFLTNPLFYLVGIFPLALFFYTFRAFQSGAEGTRADIAFRYSRIPLSQPPCWEHDQVVEVFSENQKLLAKVIRFREDQEERRKLKTELENLDREESLLSQNREAIAERLGVLPDTSPLALVDLGRIVFDYRKALTAMRKAEALLGEYLGEQRSGILNLNALFVQYSLPLAENLSDARSYAKRLLERAKEFDSVSQELRVDQRLGRKEEAEIAELEKKRTAFFKDLGLAVGDIASLEALLEVRPAYQQDMEELRGLEFQAKEKAAGLPLDYLSAPEEELKETRERLAALVSEQPELQTRVGSIGGRLEEARKGNRLERALLERDEAEEKLSEVYEKALLASAGSVLLSDVEQEYEQESQPEVFREASELFSAFTHGRYRLLPADPEQEIEQFRAWDTEKSMGLHPWQLSRGTRMQLLLASRIAFARSEETDESLPIILDEVLSSTDPERFRAIAESVLSLVSKGRQVFYLSCQPSDAEAWKQIAEEMQVQSPKIIDLSDVRRLEKREGIRALQQFVNTSSLEAPNGRSLEEYMAALAIPALDPARGGSAAHLGHLVDSAELLYGLLRAGIESFGQLETLFSGRRANAYISRQDYEKIASRASVIESFSSAWSIGRGKRLTPEVVQDACPKTKYLAEIIEKAGEVNWDAKKLLEKIDPDRGHEIKGLYKSTYVQLEENLIFSGHLVPEEPLSCDSMRMRVLAEANDAVRKGSISSQEVCRIFEALWEGSC